METASNPFGNSIGVISEQSSFTGLQEELISKLAFHMAETGMTGGMHFFETGEAIEDIRRKCDSIICFGGKDIPGNVINRLIRVQWTPVVQVDFEGSHKVLDKGRKFKTFGLWDMARMDLLSPTNCVPYVEPPEGHEFFCRELGEHHHIATTQARDIAKKIADTLGIKIACFKQEKTFPESRAEGELPRDRAGCF